MSGSLFSSMLELTGLTPDTAVGYLGQRLRVVNRWIAGAPVPPHIYSKLYSLFDKQQIAADNLCEEWVRLGKGPSIELVVAASDAEAREKGWPSTAALLRSIAIAQMIIPNISIKVLDAKKSETSSEKAEEPFNLFANDEEPPPAPFTLKASAVRSSKGEE